jgi:hypothetical protein
MHQNSRHANSVVGFNVASAMVMQAVSIDALAELLHISPDELRQCFRGDARLPVDRICVAAKRLRVTVQCLFREDDSADGCTLH